MSLKRRNRVEAAFAMSSMTDLVFLLLLFFVMASTQSSPNDLPIKLPAAQSEHMTRPLVAKVFIKPNELINGEWDYLFALGQEEAVKLNAPEELDAYLSQVQAQDSTVSVALYADENVPYKKVIYVFDVVNEHHMNLVAATKKPQ